MRKFLNDEHGASAAEYTLLMAIVAAAILSGMTALSGALATSLGRAGAAISEALEGLGAAGAG